MKTEKRNNSNAKRHHYVPEFYLQYFLQAGEKALWVYDKAGEEPRCQLPRDTAVIGRFYTIETPSGKQDMEREFSQIENVAKPILDRWQEQKAVPEPHEVREVAYLLSLLHTRVPRAAGVAQEYGLALLLAEFKQLLKDRRKAKEVWESYRAEPGDDRLAFETWMAFLENPLEDFKITMNEKVALGMSMTMIKTIAQCLVDMNWCLCEAPEPLFFLTCDAPVNIFSPHGTEALFGAGLGLKNTEVVFPVSPRICLLLDRSRTQKRRRLHSSLVKEFNRRIAYMAERYVYSTQDAKFVRRLVVEASSTYGKLKVDREVVARLHSSAQVNITES